MFLINNYDMMLGVLMVPRPLPCHPPETPGARSAPFPGRADGTEAPALSPPRDPGRPLCPLSSTSAEITLALSSVFFLESDVVSGSIW